MRRQRRRRCETILPYCRDWPSRPASSPEKWRPKGGRPAVGASAVSVWAAAGGGGGGATDAATAGGGTTVAGGRAAAAGGAAATVGGGAALAAGVGGGSSGPAVTAVAEFALAAVTA